MLDELLTNERVGASRHERRLGSRHNNRLGSYSSHHALSGWRPGGGWCRPSWYTISDLADWLTGVVAGLWQTRQPMIVAIEIVASSPIQFRYRGEKVQYRQSVFYLINLCR